MNRRSFLQAAAGTLAALAFGIRHPVEAARRAVKRGADLVITRASRVVPGVYFNATAGEALKPGNLVYWGPNGLAYKQEGDRPYPAGIALNSARAGRPVKICLSGAVVAEGPYAGTTYVVSSEGRAWGADAEQLLDVPHQAGGIVAGRQQ